MSNVDVFSRLGNDLMVEIRDKIKSTGAYATGETSASLHHTESENDFILFGGPGFKSIETGYIGDVNESRLLKWLRAKGVNHSRRITDEQYVHLLALRIKAVGTNLYRYKQTRDIYTTVIGEALNKVKPAIAESERIKLTNDITSYFKR